MALPIPFAQQNGTVRGGDAKRFGTEKDVLDLPAWVGNGEVASCWKLTWRERFSVLFFGHVWVRVHTKMLPPFSIQAIRTIFK